MEAAGPLRGLRVGERNKTSLGWRGGGEFQPMAIFQG
jgi:hypothetical protein